MSSKHPLKIHYLNVIHISDSVCRHDGRCPHVSRYVRQRLSVVQSGQQEGKFQCSIQCALSTYKINGGGGGNPLGSLWALRVSSWEGAQGKLPHPQGSQLPPPKTGQLPPPPKKKQLQHKQPKLVNMPPPPFKTKILDELPIH